MSKQKTREEEKTPNELLEDYVKIYLAADERQDELEVRFGTKHFNTLSKINFDNIIEKMKSLGFTTDEWTTNGEYTLNIQNEYSDPKTGRTKMSNIRTTIKGLAAIQQYCKENVIKSDQANNNWTYKFLQKFPKRRERDGKEILKPIDFHNFHFRVNYKTERKLYSNKAAVERLLEDWKDSRKVFRFIKRFTFVHRDYPFKVDCSIVKTSNKKRFYVPEYNIQDSNVFNNPENYEIEIELNNSKIQRGTFGASRGRDRASEVSNLITSLKKGIKIILSGWQGTNFPIAFTEKDDMLKEYLELIYGEGDVPKRRAHGGDFIGPSSVSLEIRNIIPLNIDSNTPNINNPYTVTDKADGLRKLLFISKIGKIYLIDTNMNVQFTGSVTKHKNCMNTIIDGEHVLHNKDGKFINLYLCFDIYYKNKENMKGFPFYKVDDLHYINKDIDKETFRLEELEKFLGSLENKCVIKNFTSELSIKSKTFYINDEDNIFIQCKKILDGEDDGVMFNYDTDGLIFTPCDKSVGSNKTGEITAPKKRTWIHSLKWKPSEYNTIDFLVRIKKAKTGEDFIGNVFEDGDNLSETKQLNQYKTLILHVGFNEKFDGFINPCEDVIKDNIPKYHSAEEGHYKAMPFVPYNPSANYPIYLSNIRLRQFGSNKYLLTEDNKQVFEDNTIVEFRWAPKREKFWQWVPIRVRYDKTADYQRRQKISCNAYKTAEGVWRSIHHPITTEMISTGNNIPDNVDEDIYYNRTTKTTSTRALRDFHNKYVKRKLILEVSNRGDSLIDMSVGKAGDLQKWIRAKLAFVFGLDISKDNIENRIDGACARYLKARRRNRSMPRCLFIQGNTSLNIKNGDACFTEKGKQIVAALNGDGPKDEGGLGPGVYKQYGKGKEGYNVVSNQFSIHYFFENINTFQNFLRNLNENCKMGGYVIGTCYDGDKLFRALKKKQPNDSVFVLNKAGVKMWGIQKKYAHTTFPNDELSLGYQIDVYQESINKTFSEYLVNFKYFTRMLANYGFEPINDAEAQNMGFPTAIGSFETLFDTMDNDIKNSKLNAIVVGDALNMSENERKISFLNNYFIYKKIRNPNAQELFLSFTNKTSEQEESSPSLTPADAAARATKSKQKRTVQKYKKKIKLPN